MRCANLSKSLFLSRQEYNVFYASASQALNNVVILRDYTFTRNLFSHVFVSGLGKDKRMELIFTSQEVPINDH